MTSKDPGGACLVARAMPTLPKETINADSLADQLTKLAVGEPTPDELKKKQTAAPSRATKFDRISPSDFVALQSIRSSALARKTNTTSKFGRAGSALFGELLSKGEKDNKDDETESSENVDTKEVKKVDNEKEIKTEESDEKTEKKEKKEEEKEDDDSSTEELLSRGPVRGNRSTAVAHHPYMAQTAYGVAPHSAFNGYTNGYSGYAAGYECGAQWVGSPEMVNAGYVSNSSTPDTVFTPHSDSSGYASSVEQPQRYSPFADHNMTNDDLNRLLNVNELPEALSDFILKYSRRYSASSTDLNADLSNIRSPSSRKSSTSDSAGASPKHHQRPLSTDSGCDSPMSAGSAPQRSPAGPRGGQSGPATPADHHRHQSQTSALFKAIVPKKTPGGGMDGMRTAKERLRALINQHDMDEAWAWTCKCTQYCPGALYYRDPDGDSLLHIVVWHKDLAKTYALVEQMLKTEFPPCQKPFDLPNRLHETPLFLAVEKRCEEVVSYLLEAGAVVNQQTRRPEMDAALHYASARGMTEIVQALCAHPTTDLNMPNGMGLTPLLCAVKNHGVIEEESQCLVNNKPTIRALLKAGADAAIADATNGKTVIHYAVDRMDPELVEIFKANLDEAAMTELTNMADFNRETPVQSVQRNSGGSAHRLEAEEDLRTKMFLTLLTCGATVQPDDGRSGGVDGGSHFLH
uniref:ANK_REP_REGION domain-containing protein n=1 Tax=Plectus sambesii TaxID=2011161 RepID=A0A914XN59_9BILA